MDALSILKGVTHSMLFDEDDKYEILYFIIIINISYLIFRYRKMSFHSVLLLNLKYRMFIHASHVIKSIKFEYYLFDSYRVSETK